MKRLASSTGHGVALACLRRIARCLRRRNPRRRDGAAWIGVPVKPLLAAESKECREAAND
jgi:hypothetical protein